MSAREFAPEELDAAQAALERSRAAPDVQRHPAAILADVARRYNVAVEAIRGPSRAASISRVRRLAYRELRAAGYSYPEIGRAVGRDHTTVMYGCGALKAARLGSDRR